MHARECVHVDAAPTAMQPVQSPRIAPADRHTTPQISSTARHCRVRVRYVHHSNANRCHDSLEAQPDNAPVAAACVASAHIRPICTPFSPFKNRRSAPSIIQWFCGRRPRRKFGLMVRIPTHRLLASRVHHHHETVSVYHDRCSSPSFRRHRDDNFRDTACLGCHTEVRFDPHRFAANVYGHDSERVYNSWHILSNIESTPLLLHTQSP